MRHDARMPGRGVPILAVVVGAVLAAALIPALIDADLAREGRRIAELAWGRALLIDVYAGMALFAAWIAWREPTPTRTGLWVLALLLLGNVVACVYLAYAWIRARGDAERFWHGASRQC